MFGETLIVLGEKGTYQVFSSETACSQQLAEPDVWHVQRIALIRA